MEIRITLILFLLYLDYIQMMDPAKNCTIVENFTVNPFVNANLLRLNISWSNTQENISDMMLSIHANDTNCYTTHSEPIANRHFIIKPPLGVTNPEYRFEFQCEFNITVKSAYANESCLLQYVFPECVHTLNETLCNCKQYSPNTTIDSMEKVDTGVYKVRWSDADLDKLGNKTYKHDTPYFSYGKENTSMYELANITQLDLEAKTLEVWFQDLDPGEKYYFLAVFINTFKCSTKLKYNFTAPNDDKHFNWIFIPIFLCVFIIVLTYNRLEQYVLKTKEALVRRYRRSSIFTPSLLTSMRMELNPQYTPAEILDGDYDEYEIPKSRILLRQEIGSGAFGKVCLATLLDRNCSVAVKMLCENATKEAMGDLMAEIELFKKINKHPNIVNLIGCCTIEPPYFMVMEFVPCGDLKNYLLDLRDKWLTQKNYIFFADDSDGDYINGPMPLTPTSITSSRLPSTSDTISTNLDETNSNPSTPHLMKELSAEELQNFALQIARGMAHLEQISITHRDLAARNILINEHKVLKISDFGMSRTGPYINRKSKRLPLRWMALEAITEQKCNSKSDVWSFGVVLWEIGTLGAFPYEKVLDSFLLQHLMLGKRLERPEVCTNELYDIMQRCWAANPDDRPSFEELVAILDGKKRKVYTDFCQLNPSYMFPPTEWINN